MGGRLTTGRAEGAFTCSVTGRSVFGAAGGMYTDGAGLPNDVPAIGDEPADGLVAVIEADGGVLTGGT